MEAVDFLEGIGEMKKPKKYDYGAYIKVPIENIFGPKAIQLEETDILFVANKKILLMLKWFRGEKIHGK